MENRFKREDISFYSGGIKCSAWLYLPFGNKSYPVIVMAHGLGGVKEMWLDRYAERFVAAGYACFLFDYRNYGASDGDKRQLINVKAQLNDWNSAIDFIKKDKRINQNKVLLFGSSFSGGHVITLSAFRKDITAAISQCPYIDQRATIKSLSFFSIIKFIPYVIGDLLSCLTGYHPVMLKFADPRGKSAFMSVPDYDKFIKRIPENSNFVNKAPARSILEFLKYSPSRYIKYIDNPIYISVCMKDTLVPAYATIRCAKRMMKAIVKKYECGHFDIYFDNFFDEAIIDYIQFFNSIVE